MLETERRSDRSTKADEGISFAAEWASPPTLPGLLPRPRLIRAATDRLAAGLLLVHAPAGFGKTYFLCALFRHLAAEGASALWLDTSRLGSASFAQHLREIRRKKEELANRVVSGKGERKSTSRARLCILIDDTGDRVGAAEMAEVTRLINDSSVPARVVVASRSRKSMPEIAELILRGQANTLDWRELQFTRPETARLLAGTDARQVEEIFALTSGWPAMARFAGLRIAESDAETSPDAVGAFLAGNDELVRSYMANTVLACLPEPVARLLALAEFLDHVNHDLARALGVDSKAAWDGLLDAQPLAIRGAEPGWYSFHPILSAILRHSFARRPEQERQQRHLAAAQWLSAHGRLEQAVYHAVETGDYSMAETCIRQAGSVRIFLRSGFPTLDRLMAQLPTSVIVQSSALQLCQAVVFGKQGHLDSARELVDDVKSSLRREPGKLDVPPEDVHHIDTLIAVYEDRIGNPEIVEAMRAEAKSLSPRNLWRIGWIANHMTIAHTLLGNFSDAEREALKALTCYREQDVGYAQVFMLIHLSLIAIDSGRPSSALEVLRKASALVEATQRGDTMIKAVLDVPLGQVHHALGNDTEAVRLLDDALTILPSAEAWVDIFQRAFLTRARSAVGQGDADLALRIVDQAEQVASQRGLERLSLFAKLLKMEVTVRTGLIEAASEIAESFLWLADGDWSSGQIHRHGKAWFTWREWHQCMAALARVRWAQGRRDDAVLLLERLTRSAKATGTGFDLAAAIALLFCYRWHMKQPDEARACFQLAIALVTPQKLVSVFSDEGFHMAVAIRGLLRRYGASSFSRTTIEFVNDVLAAHLREEVVLTSGSGRRLEVLLTNHEREILEHLARGLSNKAIALQIGRTEATVKYHLRRIYAKFGVSSRASAALIARDIGFSSN